LSGTDKQDPCLWVIAIQTFRSRAEGRFALRERGRHSKKRSHERGPQVTNSHIEVSLGPEGGKKLGEKKKGLTALRYSDTKLDYIGIDKNPRTITRMSGGRATLEKRMEIRVLQV